VHPTQQKLDLQGRVEHAWGKSQTARAEVQHNTFDRDGVGTGGLVLPERGYADDRTEDLLRLSNQGITRGAWATDTRLQLRREEITWTPETRATAIDVLGAFSSGGATVTGARRTWSVEMGQDFSHTLGRHSLRTGLLYEGAFLDGAERRNAEGTHLRQPGGLGGRASGAVHAAQGDPRVSVDLHRVGLYAQDDWRPTDALALNGGVRYEAQSFVDGRANFSPRLGLTWAVRPAFTVRAGAGRMFDWLEADPVAQVQSGDGTHTRDISIDMPDWPDALASGTAAEATTRRWALGANLVQPRVTRLSFGLERSFGPVRVNTEYAYERGASLLRARNLAQDGGRLFEVRAEGSSRAHTVRSDAMIGAPGRRAGGMVGYMFRNGRNDTDGPLACPADDANLAAEWGPAAATRGIASSGSATGASPDGFVSPARSSPSPVCPGTPSPAATTTAIP
jgi:hypothetical protein